MSLAHLCNTFFERELESDSRRPLAAWLRSHPVVLQLQFLPLLYAGENDLILVSDLPEHPDPRLCLLDNTPSGIELETWGFSRAAAEWAAARGIPYTLPDWELVRKINSKIFSFCESPQLPGAALLHTGTEAEAWIQKTPGPKVLKSAFGTAGTGHFHVGQGEGLMKFLNRQFSLKLPVIGEPWVARTLDFSTQWKDGKLLGTTVFENDPNGTYRSTRAGMKAMSGFEWALEKHLESAEPLVDKIFRMGYRGHLGVDAFVFEENRVHPVVEINGRKTMSWAALEIQRKRYPDRTIRFSYGPGREGVLPQSLGGKPFSRQISLVLL